MSKIRGNHSERMEVTFENHSRKIHQLSYLEHQGLLTVSQRYKTYFKCYKQKVYSLLPLLEPRTWLPSWNQ